MLCGKLWENLGHKGINTPFGSSKLSYSVDPTTQGPEFSNYYWEHFQGEIENLSRAETSICLFKSKSPQPVVGMTQIQEDTPSSYLSTLLSDVGVVLAPAESGTSYWEHFQGEIENLSRAETSIRLFKSKSPQPVVGMTQIQEDTPSSYLSTLLSDVDVVLAPAESGTAITNFTRLRKRQIEKQKLEISERFDVLAQREDNWDGYDSKKPTQPTLDHAKYLMEEFFDTIIGMKHPWITPFISSNEDGYITVEWYEEERELHILIRENEAEYLQVWGINIYTEMHEDFLSRDDYPKLLEWLLHGQKQREINIYTEMHEDFSVAMII